jgi:DNA-directed RNA polymerase specialized sigma24 family protein
MGHRQDRFEQLLDRNKSKFLRLARRAARNGHGSGAIDVDDYYQDICLVAVDVWNRHGKTKSDSDLERLIYKGAVYYLWDTWKKELPLIINTVELTTLHIDPESDAFVARYQAFFFREVKAILTQFEYEILMALTIPDLNVTRQFCHDLFNVVKHRPIQLGEFYYLSLLFQRPMREIQDCYYTLRKKIEPLLEAA